MLFRRISSYLFCTLLLCAWQCEDPEPEPTPDCIQANVIGPDCHAASGRMGYYLRLERPVAESTTQVNPTTGATEYIIKAINVPATYQQAGATFFCTVRQTTDTELAAIGPRTAICAQAGPFAYLENVSDTACTTK